MINFKSEFNKNVFTLIKGTTLAQLIVILASPILTRIYTPEDFGVFALFSSALLILGAVATGKYELALMFPRKKENAMVVFILSSIILLFVSLVLFILILIFNQEISLILNNHYIGFWLYFLPLALLLFGLEKNLNYLAIREKEFQVLSKSKITLSLGTVGTNLGVGVYASGVLGLVAGNIIGYALTVYILFKRLFQADLYSFNKFKVSKLLLYVKHYYRYPLYEVPSGLISASSRHIVAVLLVAFFNPLVAGFYYLSQRVIGLPLNVIASSISDVFRQKATEDYKKHGNAENIFVSTLKKLIVLAFFPSFVLLVFADDIFSIIFGKEWEIAGYYTQILAPLLFFRFISTPLSFMFTIVNKQNLNLIGQIALLSMIIASFLIGHLYSSDVVTIYCISATNSIFYMTYIYLSYRMAKGSH